MVLRFPILAVLTALSAMFAVATARAAISLPPIPFVETLIPPAPTVNVEPSRLIVKSLTAAEPLYDDIDIPLPALNEARLEPNATPEIVLAANLLVAMAASEAILALLTALSAIFTFATAPSASCEPSTPPSDILIPVEARARVEPSNLICNSPLENSKPLFAARSTAMVSGEVEVSMLIPSPPWKPSITEPETMV